MDLFATENGNEGSGSGRCRGSLTGWITLLLLAYCAGNLGAYYASTLLFDIDQTFGYVIPLLFLFVPASALMIVIRAGLLRRTKRDRDIVGALIVLYILTWLAAMYVYTINFFPGVLPRL